MNEIEAASVNFMVRSNRIIYTFICTFHILINFRTWHYVANDEAEFYLAIARTMTRC